MYNTIYPAYAKPYSGVNNQIVKKKEDEEQSQSSKQSREPIQQSAGQTQYQRGQFPNGQQVSIDYSKPSVNISQIVQDFKNTTMAIGASDDISSEVLGYLDLVEKQSAKDTPNKQIIQSNLKNASQILDNYITEALQKPSKVVENWIDALFLQKVEYKADKNAINPEFQIKLPEKNTETVQTAVVQEEAPQEISEQKAAETSQSDIYIPQDKQLKRMFLQAKKFSAINEQQKALTAFKQTLDYAGKIDDTQAQSMVYYEVGKIYDKSDYLPEALKSYQKAIEKSTDNNIKARSHISMAQIYDDVVQFEPAADHYFAGISYAGEADNLNAQTKALTNLANMYCNRYDKQNTFEFINLATGIAKETANDKVIASTYSKSADMSERLDENPKALGYYKESTKYYTKTDSVENIVKNYRQASEIMLKLGDKIKARTLLEKAYIKSQQLENSSLFSEIGRQLAQFK